MIMQDIIKAEFIDDKVDFDDLVNFVEVNYNKSKIVKETSLVISFVYDGVKYYIGLGDRLQNKYILYKNEEEYIVYSTCNSVKRAFSNAKNICLVLELTDPDLSSYGFKANQDY